MSSAHRIWTVVTALVLLFVVAPARETHAGIPEPGVTLYGKVFGMEGQLLTEGNLTWTYAPSGTTDTIAVSTDLRKMYGLDDVFSYAVRIPAQLEVPGLPVQADALLLKETPATYGRAAAYGGTALGFDAPAYVTVSLADRGAVERVDLYLARLIIGDIDGDDTVSAVDVQTVINTVLGLDVGGRAPLADVNGDGVVNALDIQFIINRALGIESGKSDKASGDVIVSASDDGAEPEGAEEENVERGAPPVVEGAPVDGAIGLALMAAVCALGGAFAMARKR